MSFRLSLEDLIRFILDRKKNIIPNLCTGKLDFHDTFCGRTPVSKCFLCSSLDKYLHTDIPFTLESGFYEGYHLTKIITPNVKTSTLFTPEIILADIFTQRLIMSDLVENILLESKIPCKITFGSICSNIGYQYALEPKNLTFNEICMKPELIRPLVDTKIVTSRRDDRTSLKASTVECIILNLLEIFESLLNHKILLGFPTKDNLSFVVKERKIVLNGLVTDSRLSCLLSVPNYSSAIINCPNLDVLVSTNLPFERSESKYYLNQQIIEQNSDEVFFKIRNKDKFEKLHQTGLIDFNIGMSVSFLVLILSLCVEFPFISTTMSDNILTKIWNFIWLDGDLDMVNAKILQWLDSASPISTGEILNFLTKVNIRKNLIQDLIRYSREIHQ